MHAFKLSIITLAVSLSFAFFVRCSATNVARLTLDKRSSNPPHRPTAQREVPREVYNAIGSAVLNQQLREAHQYVVNSDPAERQHLASVGQRLENAQPPQYGHQQQNQQQRH